MIVSCDMMMSVSLCLPVLHHQPVEGEVGYFSFFAGFFHCRKQFLSSRHDALRVVLVHEDAAGPDGSGCSQHDVAVLERREFDHDGPVPVLVGGCAVIVPWWRRCFPMEKSTAGDSTCYGFSPTRWLVDIHYT